MKSIKANVCVEFLKDVIYTTKSGELVSFDGEDFYYGTGKKADMDHLIFLPLIDYGPQGKAGPVPKEKEVWQFEDGEQPKLLSNNYVVETENFKRVGDWVQFNHYAHYDLLESEYSYVGEYGKMVFPVSSFTFCPSDKGIKEEFGVVDTLVIVNIHTGERHLSKGTIEELLQVLA